MKNVTCFAFIQNANLEKKVIDCLSKFKTIQFYGFVNQRVDFLERMNQFRPEILILDLSHYKSDEIDILDIIHKPPIILGIVSGKENPQFWLDKGLFDIVPSNFANDLLIRKIYKITRMFSDISYLFHAEPLAAENPIAYKTQKIILQKESDSLFIRYQKVTTKLRFNIIKVITKENKLVAVETSSNQLHYHESSIKETAIKLPQEYIIRINNATIVNINFIDKIQKNLVYIDDRVFTVSRSYYYQFKKTVDAFQKN